MTNFSCQDKTDELCESSRNIIAQTNFLIIGVGALGTAAAQALIRSGATNIVLIDDDIIDSSNIPRQVLFDEQNVGEKKVVVAKKKLLAINKEATITIINERITKENVMLLAQADIILDCTDTMTSRKIIDEFCKENDKPWVHAAVNKSFGEVIAIIPGTKTYTDLVKNKKVVEDCSITGVLSVAAIMTGTFQATIALRVVIDKEAELTNNMFRIDAWKGVIHQFKLG